MIDDLLEFLHGQEATHISEIVERFASDHWSPAKIEMLLLHLLTRGLIREPGPINVFALTDSGCDFWACSRQERNRRKQRHLQFSGSGK